MNKTTTSVSYVWRGGAGTGPGQAQMIGERLAYIERKNGQLQPEHVVDDARPISSPLHRYFEWDDSVAAEKWRVDQAQSLIRHIHVRQIGGRLIDAPTRAFVNYRSEVDGKRRYENIVTVMTDDNKRAMLLNKARQELADWRKRYDELEEFATLFPIVDRILETA